MITASEELVDAMLAKLEQILGSRVFNTLVAKIYQDYLGAEMQVRTAIIQRPDLFERAFTGMLGEMGERVLETVFHRLHAELRLDSAIGYSKFGDLPKCMALISQRSTQRTSHHAKGE